MPSKSLALKLGKEINHRLQKSKMNSLIKPYFTEGSVLYKKFDNGLEGVLLNENSINTVEMIKEIPDRFNNNVKYITEQINMYLQQNKASNDYTLELYNESGEMFNYKNSLKNRNIQYVLLFNESNSSAPLTDKSLQVKDARADEEEKTAPLSQVEYYSSPRDEGGYKTNEFRQELSKSTDNSITLRNAMSVKDTVRNRSTASDEDPASGFAMNDLEDLNFGHTSALQLFKIHDIDSNRETLLTEDLKVNVLKEDMELYAGDGDIITLNMFGEDHSVVVSSDSEDVQDFGPSISKFVKDRNEIVNNPDIVDDLYLTYEKQATDAGDNVMSRNVFMHTLKPDGVSFNRAGTFVTGKCKCNDKTCDCHNKDFTVCFSDEGKYMESSF